MQNLTMAVPLLDPHEEHAKLAAQLRAAFDDVIQALDGGLGCMAR